MKNWSSWFPAFGAAILTACGPADSQRSALADLVNRGYHFSIDEFHRAVDENDPNLLKSFVAAGAHLELTNDRVQPPQTVLRRALANRKTDAAAWLIEAGSSLSNADNDPSRSLLALAFQNGDEAIVSLILKRANELRDPALTTDMALTTIGCNDLGRLSLLLAHRPELATAPVLRHAAKEGDLPALDLLLQRGADPNEPDSSTGRTAIHEAAIGGDTGCVRLLMESEVWRWVTDREGMLPLNLAIQAGHHEVAAILSAPLRPHERELGVLPIAHDGEPPVTWPERVYGGSRVRDEDGPRHLEPLHAATIGFHSGLITPPPPRERLILENVRPSQQPLHLIQLTSKGAEIENLLKPGTAPVYQKDDVIPGTSFRIEALHLAVAPEHQALAILRHMSEAHGVVLTPRAAARAGPSCAVLHVIGTDEFYEGHAGDVFRFQSQKGHLTLAKIHPHQVILEDADGTYALPLSKSQR